MSQSTLDISQMGYQDALRKVVRERIARTALTPAAVARRAKMGSDYLSHCMRGIRPLTVEILNKLAPVLGTTVGQLHTEAKRLCG